MDELLEQVADGFVPRGLAPPWYAVVFLPAGLASGFVTVSIGYLLAHHGVSVAAIGAAFALFNLPTVWKFAVGPALDTSLSPPIWYFIHLLLGIVALVVLGLTPLTTDHLRLLSGVLLAMGVAISAAGSSATAVMALTTANEKRGAAAGWIQTGQLGGSGVGGGLGLWLAEHGGGQLTAALVLAFICALCALPMLAVRVPPRLANIALRTRLVEVLGAVWNLTRTRGGVLAILANVLPASLGAAGQLLSTVASDWHASADLVALMLGVVTGVANIPGCVIGGYLCDIFPRRTVYMTGALGCALAEAAMAWGPHTPGWFSFFVVLSAVLLGLSWAAVAAVAFEQLGTTATATVAAMLSSLSNLPVVVMVAVVGSVQVKHGSSGMLLIEAAFGVGSVLVFGLVAGLWKASPADPEPEPVSALA